MNSQTVRFARNGAFGAICLYLLVALPLLVVSMAPHTANAASAATLERPR
ncbi:hypothetical protein NA655_03390 [Pseudomonas kuykendallii]|uniref:Uncharacterized protein n=1 Tax=Pseudomonas kuykendallii TaxID=1007099 RepID=A0A1H3E222_9PSED|nr:MULTISPECIES: hypothetical protein [Pseudomonas]MCQ4270062.1 hypothetical protein [Pseudomonas kuykendallii]SDX72328.1 hypothetical protein SAMN05216287_3649 [Pseudomonas kuykendallii]